MSADIGIVFALKEEFTDFDAQIQAKGLKLTPDPDRETASYYYMFEYPAKALGGVYNCVALFIGDDGLSDAAMDTDRLIAHHQPATIVVMGIAGSLKSSIKLGEIAVAKTADDYFKSSKAVPVKGSERFDYELSGDPFKPSHDLARFLNNFEFSNREKFGVWQNTCLEHLQAHFTSEEIEELKRTKVIGDKLKITLGDIASGNTVGSAEAFAAWLKNRRDRNFVAIDMEAAGVLKAVYKWADPKKSLVLRAISDFGDEHKKELEERYEERFRRYAMHNVIQLLWSILDTGFLEAQVKKK